MDKHRDDSLQKKWQPFVSAIREESPGISTVNHELRSLDNFCPEVAYDIFGYFASYLNGYADDIDREADCRAYERERIPEKFDAAWATITPKHFTECREYSLRANYPAALTTTTDVLQLKPGAFKPMVLRRSPDPSPIVVRQFLSAEEIDRAITKLRRRIEETNKLDPSQVHYKDTKVDNVESNIRETIREVFGPHSREFTTHCDHRIWHGGYRATDSDNQRQQKFAGGIPQTVTMLEGLISRLEERREDLNSSQESTIPKVEAVAATRRVFIVHGHDEGEKQAVARFLSKLQLEPIILHEQPNQGRTIIEKFEKHTDVDFAVVLLTPDDRGYPQGAPEAAKPRARQNVIFELGYFVGRLNRSRVCALYKGNVEILSDYDGVIYISMDDPQAWQLPLAREMKAAGIEIDLNAVL
jgi:predicted nucleotide-binding protein